ncbi:hypothetical protein [Clostridium lacusfryxellense]|uniref:hypothetical protein n=1 Tax=Clostridium lacusfryxellense TaxID=205328 RepID=UPI001C0E132B|nr:hypothetical protein [Clostridium lacusfryxellense]MBU3111335.1 hypothetical protein [Clostridium lacusfryxellense]
MLYIEEHIEIYNSIIKEFDLDSTISQDMQIAVEYLTKSRIEICKFLKISNVKTETLDLNRQSLITDIIMNESNIKNFEKKQIYLKKQINIDQQKIKVIKLNINEISNMLLKEKTESKKLREDLHIYNSRERLIIFKKIFVTKYKKVFSKYSNDLSIKSEIKECNKRKEIMHVEQRKFDFIIEKCYKRIRTDKSALSQIKKNILNTKKQIEFFNKKIQKLDEYTKLEKNFKEGSYIV